MDPATISIWIIKQLVGYGSRRAQLKLGEFILGDPVQRALRNPTKIALIAATDSVLGEHASEDVRERVFAIMGMFWNSDLEIGSAKSTFTEAMQGIVATAINMANAPVVGLPDEYVTTSSLTSLSDELGIRIDGDAFAADFIRAWLIAVRNESLANEVLHRFAEVLAHERTQALAENSETEIKASIHGMEERLNETLRAAVQSAYEQGVREGGRTVERRLQWFEIHITPADRLMYEIHDDYRSGFTSTLEALQSGSKLEDAMRYLKKLRERKIAGRHRVVIIARELLKNRPESEFGASLNDPLVTYLEAVQSFQRSDAELDTTWYSAYIRKFNDLLRYGDNPRLRSNYPEIAGAGNLEDQLKGAIEFVLNEAIPKSWENYVKAYEGLRRVCVESPS